MYKRTDAIITRQIAGETLLIPVTQTGVSLQHVYLLNETAAAIWDLLQEPQDLNGLVSALQQRYEAAEEVLRRDIMSTLTELSERGFASGELADE